MKSLIPTVGLLLTSAGATNVLLHENRASVGQNNQFGIHRHWNSWNFGKAANDKDLSWWVDDAYEYGDVRLDSIHYGPGNNTMEFIEQAVSNVAGRKRQMIFKPYIQLTGRHANYTNEPKNTGVPDYLLQHNVTNCQNYNYWIPDYNNPYLLSALEETIAAMGATFDNDPRLFAVQIGFVGEDGLWAVDKAGVPEKGARRCEDSYPTEANTAKIINAFRTAFPNTLLLMPNPWLVKYDFTKAPEIGILDPDFGSVNYTNLVTSVGLEERWKTAPVVAAFRPDLETCWFTRNPSAACLSMGVTTNVTTIDEEIALRHPVTIRVNDAIEAFKTDNSTQERIRAVNTVLGFQPHISQVSLQVSNGELRVCSVIENIGSSPFYTPPSRPLTMTLSMNDDTFVMNATQQANHTDLSNLLPGQRETFLYQLPWVPINECLTVGNAICQAHGQTCEDKNTSPYTRGDWYCKCPNRVFEERGRPAVCSVETKYRNDPVKWYDKYEKTVIGDPATVGVQGASYTISFWAKIPACFTSGCGTDSIMNNWEVGVVLGSGEWMNKGKGLQLAYQSLKFTFRNGDTCDSKEKPPLNEWVHVVYAHDISTRNLSIFLNSVLVSNCTDIGQNNGTLPMTIGQSYRDDDYYRGWIRDFRIMETSIPHDEIVRLYEVPPAEDLPVSVNLQMKTTFQTRGPLTFASVHGNLSQGILSLAIPQETPFSAEGCLTADPTPVPQTNTPTAIPTNPPAATTNCYKLQLSGFTATVRTASGNVSAQCDGIYVSDPTRTYWIKDDYTRELWRLPYDNYKCTFMGAARNGDPSASPHFGYYEPEWWGGHLSCLEMRTAVPTIAPTPLPPGETFVPPTPAPPTPLPAWMVQTKVPTSPVPSTPLPVGSTLSPSTDVPQTSSPAATVTTSSPSTNNTSTVSPTTQQPSSSNNGSTTQSPPTVTPSDWQTAGKPQVMDADTPIWFFIMLPLIGVLVLLSIAVWVMVYLKKKAQKQSRGMKFGDQMDDEDPFDTMANNPSATQPIMGTDGNPPVEFNEMGATCLSEALPADNQTITL